MDVWEAIESRRAIRTFTGKKIPKSDLEKMVDAARLAPSARNEQRWDFIVVTQGEGLKQITSHFKTRRKFGTEDDGKFDGTSAIIAVVLDGSHEYWREDGSAATQNILLTARDLGWGSCWIEGQMGPHEEKFKELLGVPKDRRILSLIALGEPVQWSPGPPKKRLSQVLHRERYGGIVGVRFIEPERPHGCGPDRTQTAKMPVKEKISWKLSQPPKSRICTR